MANPLVFGDFATANAEAENLQLYEDLRGYDEVKNVFNQVLERYNTEAGSGMNLVLFQDALEHVCRIHRIIRMPSTSRYHPKQNVTA